MEIRFPLRPVVYVYLEICKLLQGRIVPVDVPSPALQIDARNIINTLTVSGAIVVLLGL
jgi:hypothetical protein